MASHTRITSESDDSPGDQPRWHSSFPQALFVDDDSQSRSSADCMRLGIASPSFTGKMGSFFRIWPHFVKKP
eukprot:CAMPEP_0174722788 /NCGR_PEP_ID=MMETSP1094-20130205/39278_1 /TAXON_ID=156173 /ORGANISM="Chrysochromulina brevifilum, Strain UTEX LB 985" /LENGTH=71 /DNA_ID=CAMNT_0015923711 /DNA_START=546 /DNA_END=757 /DNA_ORIENTATION=-